MCAMETDTGTVATSEPVWTPADVVIAVLQERFRNLDNEAKADLFALFNDIPNCHTKEDVEELRQAMRELLFPDEMMGKIISGSAGAVEVTERLQSRMVFLFNLRKWPSWLWCCIWPRFFLIQAVVLRIGDVGFFRQLLWWAVCAFSLLSNRI